MQVAPGVYAIQAVGSTVYLLGGIQLTLVDAGGPGSAPRVLRHVRRLEHAPQDLTRILLTHVDLEHVGGLAALVAATGSRVYAHPLALRRLQAGQIPGGERGWRSRLVALRGLFARRGAIPPAEPLQDGALLPILGGVEALHTGGHTPDHAVFLVRQPRLLLTGDLLQVSRGHLQALPGPTARERGQTVAALRRLAALDPLAILPAHGPPYRDNIALRLVRLAEVLEE